jgi:hypothetical protein
MNQLLYCLPTMIVYVFVFPACDVTVTVTGTLCPLESLIVSDVRFAPSIETLASLSATVQVIWMDDVFAGSVTV